MCGQCCRLFLINLNSVEYLSGRFQTVEGEPGFDNYAEAEEAGVIFLARTDDGSCIYLVDNKCSIHESRPEVCRGFFCDTKEPKYQKMVEIIENEKIQMANAKSSLND
jgi:Fe-S-cluster containining protein